MGALEDADADIYDRDALSNYDSVLGGEEPGDGLYGWTAPAQYKKKMEGVGTHSHTDLKAQHQSLCGWGSALKESPFGSCLSLVLLQQALLYTGNPLSSCTPSVPYRTLMGKLQCSLSNAQQYNTTVHAGNMINDGNA